ncbi:hypothetical protein [Psychrobacillus lasiicapitis]|uniref:Stage III sporulation protein AD n=1 Tax=Psychrobacillus lasiicapitis TaxID=1636719 RepID=A0A544TAX0_9BACI|nr:hypothetical protein [Psychrobacillus lasiicapitis]TQR14508.1 hypothetical protein FG382_08615 [Psychrobacillus lasiicapitis]GGA30758.1 hypothetical protein GCM10011384_20290 [Psychrobacillus lasiicapitis]
MIVYVTIILAFCLLELVKETYPRLHSIIYTIYIFLFLTYLVISLIIPFVTHYFSIVPVALLPVFKLLLFSVLLLFITQIVEELLSEYEYTSLATMFTFTTKAIILLAWLQHMKQFYEKFFSVLGLLS